VSDEALRIVGEVEIAKLSLRTGDVLVLRVNRSLSSQMAERIREHAERFLPDGAKCMVLDDSFEVSVMTGPEVGFGT
jgi:hypothetical protein